MTEQTNGNNKKRIDQATKHVWPGKWLDNYYVLKNCPICDDEWTFRFYGKRSYIWECKQCGNSGGPEQLLEMLREIGKYADKMEGIFDDLTKGDDPEGLIVVSRHRPRVNTRAVSTGFAPIDRLTGGLPEGALTIMSGDQRSGKSTWAGQLALNAIQSGEKVCFYSGELNADMFQRWIYNQAAGPQWLNAYTDKFGVERYSVDDFARSRIEQWLDDNLVLHDNTYYKASESNSVLKSFIQARRHFGSTLFFADNLMTMKNDAGVEGSYWREQSKMVGDLIDFAQQENVHVILVAHPRKEKSEDRNRNVAGSQEVTQRASFVMTVERLTPEVKSTLLTRGVLQHHETTNVVIVSKNRIYGDEGQMELAFEPKSKRLVELPSKEMVRYGWEELI